MNTVIQQLKLHINKLPGADAQYLMAPPIRKLYADTEQYKASAKQSAVCVALHLNDDNEWCVYLMQRTNYGVHGNQISFPGGKVEPSDESYLHTALREFNEEMGALNRHETIGMLTPLYIPPSNFYVEPYLIVMQEPLVLNPNNDEVVKVYSFTLKQLFAQENVSTYTLQKPNAELQETPCFIIDTTVIWGATAMIISELKQWCIAENILV